MDFDDFLEFVGHFGARSSDPRYETAYDLTADGRIDFADFLEFVSYFGLRIPASSE